MRYANRWITALLLLTVFARPALAGDTPHPDTTPADTADTDVTPAPEPWLRLKINIAAKQLAVIEHDQVVARYDVAIGSPRWPSPTMTRAIERIIWNPSWIPPDSPWAKGAKVTPPGPNNPLGPVKMPIGNGILIHGTNKPHTVGHAASHGCFRMHSAEAGHLAWYIQSRLSANSDPSLWERYQKYRYSTVWVKLDQAMPVDVVYETVEVRDGTVHLYPDVYRKVRDWNTQVRTTLDAHGYAGARISDATLSELQKQLRKGAVSLPVQDVLDGRVAALVPVATASDKIR